MQVVSFSSHFVFSSVSFLQALPVTAFPLAYRLSPPSVPQKRLQIGKLGAVMSGEGWEEIFSNANFPRFTSYTCSILRDFMYEMGRKKIRGSIKTERLRGHGALLVKLKNLRFSILSIEVITANEGPLNLISIEGNCYTKYYVSIRELGDSNPRPEMFTCRRCASRVWEWRHLSRSLGTLHCFALLFAPRQCKALGR